MPFDHDEALYNSYDYIINPDDYCEEDYQE